MKRALVLLGVVALGIVGYLSVRGTMPFMAILGTSMEPALSAGNLILIKEANPADVKVGDIIVFTIPQAVQDAYNYPPIVAHRVIKINTERGVTFRTKGDNTGEDPFTVRAQDLKGTVSSQVPYAGFPLLFFQSRQGLIFLVVALTLFALYLYADELSKGRQLAHRGLFGPVIEENQRGSLVIAQRVEATEKKIDNTEKTIAVTQQALEKFAAAIELYAQHLQSHTSAIQGLAQASHELKNGAAEQNRVLAHLLEAIEQGKSIKGMVGEVEAPAKPAPAPELKKPARTQKFPPGCAKFNPRDVGKA